MKPELVLTALLVLVGLESISSEGHPPSEFFALTVNDIRGEPVKFDQFKGKVTLLVNTASQCAFTETQLKSLKRLYDILSHGGRFNVVAFPCNEFGDQEPWENMEIEEYYRGHFHIEFMILQKGSVADSPLWNWVAANAAVKPTDNFHKYLIDGEGKIAKNWSGDVSVESIFDDVQKLVDSVAVISEEGQNQAQTDSNGNTVKEEL